ncbi:alpha-L-rhamnosidase [Dysgonomonas sp. 216]|uniref:alpha-L-rhamnosidase n=1 Tax=Dysgonomonas sp. 216 TaxID=2302934 RepID=UPI0013D2C420|nr:alpha-L-rhamnosidase [Dysgonomonas sp. 216]NDW19686.1 alpha-L-rhamnosidase [Dysgonomonas sp. 216]
MKNKAMKLIAELKVVHKFLFILLLFLCLFACCGSLSATNKVKVIRNLKVEYTKTPLGIDVENPRFSWQMSSEERGISQTAYQIIVTDEFNQKVWDSGKVNDNISLNIKYAGHPLSPCTRYNWKLTVWNNRKEKKDATSWFETGLMNPNSNLLAWNGAKWIGGTDSDLPLYPYYLPVFKLNYSLQLDEATQTTKAGFVYGANDSRLMDKNKNLYGLKSKLNESYLLVELDIQPLFSGNLAQIHIYRTGYHPDDKKNIPLKSFPIPTEIINDKNKYGKQTIFVTSVLGYTQIYIDNEGRKNRVGEINLNPLGRGGDFIAFPMLSEIGFSVAQGQACRFSDIEIRNYRSPSNILFTEDLNKQPYGGIFSETSDNITVSNSLYEVRGKNSAAFVIANPQQNSMPMLRTTFSVSDSSVKKARLYVTSRGVYEIFINGKRIGDDYFNPGLTQYNKTHLYQTYDVTNNIISGKNAIGAILGEGWWSGGATYMGDFWNFFGDRQSLLAKLVITYTDGREDVIITNPETWNYFNNGPLLYGSFFQGEIYDATKEHLITGWATGTYNDSGWTKAIEVGLEKHISYDETNKHYNMPMIDDYSNLSLVGQFGETVKKIKELTAVSVEEVRPGVFVYDMGQNMAGVPKIELSGMEKGKNITLRFAEVKYPDLPEYEKNVGMLMLENIRAAMSQDVYIAKGGNETISPRFTFHGYRFVEITGIPEALPLNAVKGEVLSSVLELSSKYETSNNKVNKLWENIVWSTYSNFISIPTDCPQRNERLGWSGDISIFSRTATYLSNISQFLKRHMLAMRDVQREDGRFPDIAPIGGGFGGVLWGSAAITVPWESFQQYGDKELLVEHYAAMKNYIDYLLQQIDGKTNIFGQKYVRNWGSLGDWLSPEYDRNEKSLLWEAYFIYDLELMNKIASLLGENGDAERFKKLHTERKEFFNKTYINKETGETIFPNLEEKKVDTQVSYVLPLAFGIIDEATNKKVVSNFVNTVKRENMADNKTMCPPYSLMTGFIGTAWINKALSDNGYTDIAYDLLQQTTYPSWLYSVEQGATTIWERLNSYTHTNGFGGNNRMNSFNHYSFGAVCAWMYNYSLGIERDESNPGFKHFILKPEPDPTGKMTYAKGHYDSMYGRIKSSWQIDGNKCLYKFTVPANTSATLFLKAPSLNNIKEGKKPLAQSKGIKYLQANKNTYAFELSAGVYQIEVQNNNKY